MPPGDTGQDRPPTRRMAEELVDAGLLDAPDLFAPGADDEPPPLPPEYEPVRFIGRGGAGAVYLAREHALDRHVAIKFLHDASRADLERFRREARYTARLSDPAIVQVYRLDDFEGRPFIAMQYVEGGNLADARLDHGGVADVLRQVAHALRHAHGAGIVHRDVKPENILVDGAGHAYVTDFGIARDLRRAMGETLSHDGQIVGTPALMPPEQARGDVQAIDARSDVYALGATMFVKLTGRYPYLGDGLVDILHRVMHDEPPLPRSLVPAIPRELEAIIVRCMQKRRADRYQTMGEVAAALEAFTRGAPVDSAPNVWFRRLVAARADAPEAPTVDVTAGDTHTEEAIDVVRDIAAWDADLYRVTASLVRSFARLDELHARLDRIVERRPDLAWARFYRGVVRFRRGRLDDALDDMERSVDRVGDTSGASFELGRLYLTLFLREHHRARKHLSRIGTTMHLAEARERLGQAGAAFRVVRSAAGAGRGGMRPWHAAYARAVTLLANEDFDGCVDACTVILDEEPDLDEVWKLCGDARRFAARDEEALDCYGRAIEVRRSSWETHFARAEVHRERGDLDSARRDLERACAIHPEFAAAVALLARTHLDEVQRPVVAARASRSELLEGGWDLAERAGALDPTSYDAAITRAELALERARADGDVAWIERALDMLARVQPLRGCQNRVQLLVAHTRLEEAKVALGTGDAARAEGAIAAARAVFDAVPTALSNVEPWRAVGVKAARLADRVERHGKDTR